MISYYRNRPLKVIYHHRLDMPCELGAPTWVILITLKLAKIKDQRSLLIFSEILQEAVTQISSGSNVPNIK